MNGLHLIAELHDCRCARPLLQSVDALRELCLAVCAVPGLTPVGQVFHQFGSEANPAGATGAGMAPKFLCVMDTERLTRFPHSQDFSPCQLRFGSSA